MIEIPMLTIILVFIYPFAFCLGIVAAKTGRPRFVVWAWAELCLPLNNGRVMREAQAVLGTKWLRDELEEDNDERHET